MIVVAKINAFPASVRLNGFLAVRSRPDWRTTLVRDVDYWFGRNNWLHLRPGLPAGGNGSGPVEPPGHLRVMVCDSPDEPDVRTGDFSAILCDVTCRGIPASGLPSFRADDRIKGSSERCAAGDECRFRSEGEAGRPVRLWESAEPATPESLRDLASAVAVLRSTLATGNVDAIRGLFASHLADRARLYESTPDAEWDRTGIPFLLEGPGDWIVGDAEPVALASDPSRRVSWAELPGGRSPFRRRALSSNVVSQLYVSWSLSGGTWNPMV